MNPLHMFGATNKTVLFAALISLTSGCMQQALATDIVTYHYNNMRTGWNDHETQLTSVNVNANGFGLLHSTAVNDQVDAQPLYVAGVEVRDTSRTPAADLGKHDVIYVATASNTVYEIDATSGLILIQRTLGKPVPKTIFNCNNNGPNVGITSTPVIDVARHGIFVVAFLLGEDNKPSYRLYALDLSTLADQTPSRVISASHQLSDGETYKFIPDVQRQRPALLEANGAIYAGFGSFCDHQPQLSRGWVLGWSVADLAPLPGNHLVDTRPPASPPSPATQPPSLPYFLSAIWMSGYGIASDGGPGQSSANLYFTTGNSDRKLATFGPTNLEESLVKLAPNLAVSDFFTPKEVTSLDAADMDFGAGGVLLVPDRPGSPQLAASLAKAGKLYIVDRGHLGKFDANVDHVLGTFMAGQCWCGLSYFVGDDSVERIVSSGGNRTAKTADVTIWKVNRAASIILSPDLHAPPIPSGQFPGVFTSVTSNGQKAGSAVIWLVSRPLDANPAAVSLFAINPKSGAILYSAAAGSWPNVGGDANIVPVVADGRAFVASYKQVLIFGLGGSQATSPLVASTVVVNNIPAFAPVPAKTIYGVVVSIWNDGKFLKIELRSGASVVVDARPATEAYMNLYPVVGDAIEADGEMVSRSVFRAKSISRAKDAPELWHQGL